MPVFFKMLALPSKLQGAERGGAQSGLKNMPVPTAKISIPSVYLIATAFSRMLCTMGFIAVFAGIHYAILWKNHPTYLNSVYGHPALYCFLAGCGFFFLALVLQLFTNMVRNLNHLIALKERESEKRG